MATAFSGTIYNLNEFMQRSGKIKFYKIIHRVIVSHSHIAPCKHCLKVKRVKGHMHLPYHPQSSCFVQPPNYIPMCWVGLLVRDLEQYCLLEVILSDIYHAVDLV